MSVITKPIPTLTEIQIVRFWNGVEKKGESECWPWLGGLSPDGYGNFEVRVGENKQRQGLKTHRVAYFLHNGVDPDQKLVRHSDACEFRKCCNPAHLKLGTHQDNADDLARTRRLKKPTGKLKLIFDVVQHADGTFFIDLGDLS